MKLLLIHRYFWPDTPPYASMLRSIGKRLVADGHEVSILSSQPSYKASVSLPKQPAIDQLDGMTIHRVKLLPVGNSSLLVRLFNIVYFPIRVLWFLLFNRKYDIVMVSTVPPVLIGAATAIGTKLTGSKFFYHCMDVHPEIGALSGEFKNPFLFRLLRSVDTFSCNVAHTVIVLSDDMKLALQRRSGMQNKDLRIINNFAMPDHKSKQAESNSLLKVSGTFRVIFAGNIGRFQGLEAFIEAMKLLQPYADIELTFVGDGTALPTLRELAQGMGNVTFLPHQSVGVAKAMIMDADLGIVSLSKDIYKYAYPSKTMTYLEQGCPLLVSVEKESCLVEFIEESNIGVPVEHSSAQSIADAILSVRNAPHTHDAMRNAARKAYKENFFEQEVLKTWSRLFSEFED